VRLADAGVTDPEPYVVPIALVALVLGHLRRRRAAHRLVRRLRRRLTALLLPEPARVLRRPRPLWAPAGAAGVARSCVLRRVPRPLRRAAAHRRRRAGGGRPAPARPARRRACRAGSCGRAGALLLGVGATYEQRLRDLGRLRSRYDALALGRLALSQGRT
jgi:hypothetical protein